MAHFLPNPEFRVIGWRLFESAFKACGVNSDQQYYCDPPIRKKKKLTGQKRRAGLRGNQRPEPALFSSTGLVLYFPRFSLVALRFPGFSTLLRCTSVFILDITSGSSRRSDYRSESGSES